MSAPTHLLVRYDWRESSVPPPHYYEFTIEAGPTRKGGIRFCPGYVFQKPPVWTEAFEAQPSAWEYLQRLLHGEGFLDETPSGGDEPVAVGGNIHTLEIQTVRQHVTWRSFGQPDGAMLMAVNAVKALVPADVWSDLRERHAQYIAEGS